MTLRLRVAAFAVALYLKSALSTSKGTLVLVEEVDNTARQCTELDSFTEEALDKLWPHVFGSELFTCPPEFLRFQRLKVEYFNQLETRLISKHGLTNKQAQGIIVFADRLRSNWRKGEYLGGKHDYFCELLADVNRWIHYNALTKLQERAWIVRQDLLNATLGDMEEQLFEALRRIEVKDSLADIDVPLPLLDLLAFAGIPTVYHTRKETIDTRTPITFKRKTALLV